MTHSTALETTTSAALATSSDIQALEFITPMPGFPQHTQFALVELVEGSPLGKLQSLQDKELSFLVAPPASLFSGYAPEIDDESAAALEISSMEETLLVVVITAGKTLAESTANLLAPVVINTRTMRAKQVILDDHDLSVATPLMAA